MKLLRKIFVILFILLILSLAFYSYGSLVVLNSIDVYISSDRIVDYGNDNYNLFKGTMNSFSHTKTGPQSCFVLIALKKGILGDIPLRSHAIVFSFSIDKGGQEYVLF